MLSYKSELETDDIKFINKVIKETGDSGILFPELNKCKNVIRECYWIYTLYNIFSR